MEGEIADTEMPANIRLNNANAKLLEQTVPRFAAANAKSPQQIVRRRPYLSLTRPINGEATA